MRREDQRALGSRFRCLYNSPFRSVCVNIFPWIGMDRPNFSGNIQRALFYMRKGYEACGIWPSHQCIISTFRSAGRRLFDLVLNKKSYSSLAFSTKVYKWALANRSTLRNLKNWRGNMRCKMDWHPIPLTGWSVLTGNTANIPGCVNSRGGVICSIRVSAVALARANFLLFFWLKNKRKFPRTKATAIRVCCKWFHPRSVIARFFSSDVFTVFLFLLVTSFKCNSCSSSYSWSEYEELPQNCSAHANRCVKFHLKYWESRDWAS